VAAWVSDMFCNFYLGKNEKIAKNSKTTKAGKNRHSFRILRIFEFFDLCLSEFEKNQILLSKIIHRSLLTIKIFAG
jgi:hypothetical protein